MSNHEEGEFELVLGNKQLLSVFFLVILLLGVFFSMGYIVGRNTAPATSLSASSKQPPIMVEPTGAMPPPVRPTPPDTSKPSALATPAKLDPTPPPVEPPKVTKVDPPKPVEPPKVAKVDPPKPADPPKVTKVDPPKPAKVDPPKVAATTKGGGTYFQVVATKQPEANQVVAKLAAKGFPASISPVPDSTLVRVIVGPLGDAAATSKIRDGLQAEGYKPFVKKF